MNTEKRKEMFLQAFKQCAAILHPACEAAGVHRNTVLNWRNNDPEFREKYEEIEEMQIDVVEAQLLKNIKAGDTSAAIFYMKTKGKKRGYTARTDIETQSPVTQVPAQPSQDKAKSKRKTSAKAAVEVKKKYITRLLKKEGKYTAELSVQVKVAARLMVRLDEIDNDMSADDYQPIITEYSREGNRRDRVNPKERLVSDLSKQLTNALRALGMNFDAKERKTEDDSFKRFIEANKQEDD